MDKTKEYVEMSDCEEVQGSYKEYCDEFSSYFWNELKNYQCSKCGYCGSGKFCEDCGSELVIKESGYISCDDNPSESKYIWLPRQDQLQDMVIGEGVYAGDRLADFLRDLSRFKLKTNVGSMEQLLLRYVMKVTFGKVLEGGKWE